MNFRLAAISLLASVLHFTSAAAQAAASYPEVIDGTAGRMMDEYLSRAAVLGFSGQVLAARNGKILLHRAYGFSDRAGRVPFTTTTSVGVASMSKQFTAAAILKLVSEKRLRLTDTLGFLLDGVPPDKRGITVSQLVTHTSGIRGGVTEDFDVPTLDSSIARLMSLPLTGKPGDRWRYSSDAYGILAAIVQRVSGVPFERYMHENILGPAGMSHSGFWIEAPSMPEVAHAYAGLRDSGTPRNWPRNWRVFGSGDLITTASDLYRWEQALRAGKIFKSEVVAQYMTGLVPTGYATESYGFGLFVGTSSRKTRMIEHGGDTELGYNGAFFRYPDEDAVLIITSNSRDVNFRSFRQYVQAEIEAILFGSDTTKAPASLQRPDANVQASLTGSYQIDSMASFHLLSDGAFLWIAADGQNAVDLLRAGTPDVPATSFANAADRTRTLINGLMQFDSAAYITALSDSGAAELPDYLAEWRRLLSENGPIRGFRVRGTVRQGNSLITTVVLNFLRGERPMSFAWSRLGQGRLNGTNAQSPAPYPIVLPVGSDSTGRFVAYDLWRLQPRAVFSVVNGGRIAIRRPDAADSSNRVTSPRTLASWRP
jgi:CubicO group peptidase (beta-lactamase class C family)